MRKLSALFLAVLMCLCLAACEMPQKQEKLTDEEVVNAFIAAFQAGDYAAMQPYIDADNPLHEFFANMDPETGGALAPAYQAAFEKLKSITCTAQAVEGKEAWGTVSAAVSAPDFSAALHDAMTAALSEQVETGSGAFRDMPSWIAGAVQRDDIPAAEETFELHVGNRDGEMVMDSNTNRQFFAMLCGGLKPYLKASVTTCTFLDGSVWDIFAQGDEIAAMLSEETVTGISEYAQEDINAVIQDFEGTFGALDGVCAHAEAADDILSARFGVDMENASTTALSNLGIINDRITAGSNGWLSLDSTVSGFTREGASCVTENFK